MNDFSLVPFYIQRHLDSIFGIANLRFIIDLRGSFLSRFLYTKITLLILEFIKFLDFLSPKLYFQNPVLFILFPFWVFGILSLIKERKFKIFAILFIFGFIGYLIGEKRVIFLFPVEIIYILISIKGIKSLI